MSEQGDSTKHSRQPDRNNQVISKGHVALLNSVVHDISVPIRGINDHMFPRIMDGLHLRHPTIKNEINEIVRKASDLIDLTTIRIKPDGTHTFRSPYAQKVKEARSREELTEFIPPELSDAAAKFELEDLRNEIVLTEMSKHTSVLKDKDLTDPSDLPASISDDELVDFITSPFPHTAVEVERYFKGILPKLRNGMSLLSIALQNTASKIPGDDPIHSTIKDCSRYAAETSIDTDGVWAFFALSDPESTEVLQQRKQVSVKSELGYITDMVEFATTDEKNPKVFYLRVDQAADISISTHPVLRQAWLNLIGNASKYSKNRININASIVDGNLLVVVADNGNGIAFDEQEKIFQMGVQGTGAIPSSGVGLGMAKQIVEKLGGRVGIDSAPGKGAAFYTLLPLDPDTKLDETAVSQAVLRVVIDTRNEVLKGKSASARIRT